MERQYKWPRTDAEAIEFAKTVGEFEYRENFEIGTRAGQPNIGYIAYQPTGRDYLVVKKAVVASYENGIPWGTKWILIDRIPIAKNI